MGHKLKGIAEMEPLIKPTKYVTLHWYCGCAIGAPKWQGTEIYECDECEEEGYIAVPEEDWLAGVASVVCTHCHRDLFQGDGHFQQVTPKGKKAIGEEY